MPLTPRLPSRVTDRSRWWSYEDALLLLLLAALLYLPGLGATALFDRDEPRFASAGRYMLQSGNFIVPYFNGELRPDKPPLIYWLMSASYWALGAFNELAARLPSALCAGLTLLVVYAAAGSRFGRVTGIVAALILGSSVMYVVEARLATADAAMILFTALAFACAWRAWDAAAPRNAPGYLPQAHTLPASDEDEQTALDLVPAAVKTGPVPFPIAMLFWVALALGTLAKGVPLMFVLLPMLTLSVATAPVWAEWRRYRWPQRLLHLPELFFRAIVRGNWSWWRGLRPLIGVPLLILIVGAWVAAVWNATTPPGELIRRMIAQQHDRVLSTGSVTTYKQPPGFYFLLIWATFWPWTPLLVPMAYHALKRLRGKTVIAIDPRPYQFLIAWIVPTWIVLELVRSKLPHYTLPLYIALAILCADTLVQSWHRLTDVLAARWLQAARLVWVIVWFVLAAGMLAFTWYFLGNPADHELFWRAIPFAGAMVATGVIGGLAWGRPAWPFVTVMGWCMALVLLNATVLPEIKELQVSKLAMRDAVELRDRGYATATLYYQEPTLVFYSDPQHPDDHLTMIPKPLPPQDRTPQDEASWQQLQAFLRVLFNDAPKHLATTRPASPPSPESIPATRPTVMGLDPTAATVLITDDEGLKVLEALGLHPIVWSTYAGFRTDNLDFLRHAFLGPAAKPTRQFHGYVLLNRRPTPATLPATATAPH